jgi:hypothetical protein
MKKFFTLLFAFFMAAAISAQKVIEKNIEHKGRKIDVDVKFASEIQVKTWDKSTVYFKADIMTKNGEYLDLYELDVDESASTISITSKPEVIFEKLHDDYEKEHPGKRGRHFSTGDEYEFNYTLFVPRKAVFKISSINGSLNSDLIDGDFTADLINGDIDISKYAGNLNLKTINGEIDLTLVDTSITAETINGDIYADEKLELKVADQNVGQKVSGKTTNAISRLALHTINGNMYLRY